PTSSSFGAFVFLILRRISAPRCTHGGPTSRVHPSPCPGPGGGHAETRAQPWRVYVQRVCNPNQIAVPTAQTVRHRARPRRPRSGLVVRGRRVSRSSRPV